MSSAAAVGASKIFGPSTRNRRRRDLRIPAAGRRCVGHEIDVTISDLSPITELTPSHAITDLTPDRQALLAGLADAGTRMREALARRVTLARQRLDVLAARRAFREPLDRVRDLEKRLDDYDGRLERSGRIALGRARDRVAAMAGRLQTLSPLNVLARGYSLTYAADGRLLKDAEAVAVGEAITTRLAAGEVVSRVEQVRPAAEVES